MPTKRRKTPPPFAMTPLLLDALVDWAFTEALLHMGEVEELSPAQEEQVKAALETTLHEEFQREVVGDMAKPPAMDDVSIRRASFIKVLANQRLEHDKDFEDALGGFRSLLEGDAVEFRLKWFWPPVKDPAGNVSMWPPPRTRDEDSSSSVSPVEQILLESASEALEAYHYLFLHHLPLLDEVMKARESDPELVTLALVRTYKKMRGGRGLKRSGPTPLVATRVSTIEALRELCNLSQADARRLWNHWFMGHERLWEAESGAQYGRDLRTVGAYTRSHMVLEASGNRKLTEQEIQEMVDGWRAKEKH